MEQREMLALFGSRTVEEQAFADESDRLGEIAAEKTGKRHWGRWVLDSDMLVTFSFYPASKNEDDNHPDDELVDDYWIALRYIKKGGAAVGMDETWFEHLSGKNWIGLKGLTDFNKAIDELVQ